MTGTDHQSAQMLTKGTVGIKFCAKQSQQGLLKTFVVLGASLIIRERANFHSWMKRWSHISSSCQSTARYVGTLCYVILRRKNSYPGLKLINNLFIERPFK